VVEDLQESISNVKEISELLGHGGVEDVTDDDLDNEFMEFTALETITEAPCVVPQLPETVALIPPMELRTAVFERGF
jgi:hypothetical protein